MIRSIKKGNITQQRPPPPPPPPKKKNQKPITHFQNEAKFKTFLAKTSFIALSLIFKQRLAAIAYGLFKARYD